MDEPPIPLKGKARRLKSLNEFQDPYFKGLFQPWREDAVGVSIWIIAAGFVAGVAIGIVLLT